MIITKPGKYRLLNRLQSAEDKNVIIPEGVYITITDVEYNGIKGIGLRGVYPSELPVKEVKCHMQKI